MEINKIHITDCLPFMQQCATGAFTHTVTSPPYNMNLRINKGKYVQRSTNERTKYNRNYADALPMDSYLQWQYRVISELLRVTQKYIFYNVQMVTGNKPALMKLLGAFAQQIKEIVIWNKQTAEPSVSDGVLNSQFEFILILSNNAQERWFTDANFERGTLSNVWNIPKNHTNTYSNHHQAVMPSALAYTIVSKFTNQNDIIFDPFAGTGTTFEVCQKLKRNFVGCEINPQLQNIQKTKIQGAAVDLFAA